MSAKIDILEIEGALTAGSVSIPGGADLNAHASRHNPGGADAVATAAAVTISGTTTNQEGNATSLSRSNHTHLITMATAAQSIGAANSAGSGAEVAFANHVHQGIHSLKALAGGTQRFNDIVFLQSGFVGLADDGAGNFTFSVPIGLVGDIPQLNATNAAAAGATGRAADAGHIHTILANVAPAQSNANGTNSVGTSAALARADHKHDILANVAPAQSNANGSSDVGTSAALSRADHKHDILANVTPSSTGSANAVGTSSALARADHVHNTVLANQFVTAAAAANITQQADTLITTMTITPAAGIYRVYFQASVTHTQNNSTTSFNIYSGGTLAADSELDASLVQSAFTLPVSCATVVTVNGSQAIEVRARTTLGNTASFTKRTLRLLRIG